uniref:SEFIR domain protein n=1 Tax=Solibacter usitatus (strain Ellin6076) TaxID=234267 RepID=Q01P11_SOLUE
MRIFISYSHDSEEHRRRVLALADRLRADGIDATIDQYLEPAGPAEGWPQWMEAQLRTADFVLAVCSAKYRKRVEGDEAPGAGHGVAWEGRLIYQHIYNAASENRKFVPVLLGEATREDIPVPLQGVSNHRADEPEGYASLYGTLTGAPRVRKAELGAASGPVRRRRKLPAAAMAAVAAVLLGGIWLWNRAPGEYEVQVAVVDDASGNPAGGAQVTASVPGVLLKADSGWLLKVAGSAVPESRTLVVHAAEGFLSGEQEVRLGRSAKVATTVRMRSRTDGLVRGTVVDSKQRAVAGARVTIAGQSDAAVTDANGGFTLPAHAANGQVVQLRVEKQGYRPVLQGHPAGDTAAFIVIDR